jgi:formylglycine-generating enzyme required for sulfatase activity
VMGSNPSNFKGEPTRPVEQVNWDEASAFCRKLGELAGEQAARAVYRLPTEAEGEYACRAGTTTKWCCGDDDAALNEYAWHAGNAGGTTHPVRQKTPNAWGLYDTQGNVWEWCQDWFSGDYYKQSPDVDPTGPREGSIRVFRGGSWWYWAEGCRSAYRDRNSPSSRNHDIGFRVVRSLSGT